MKAYKGGKSSENNRDNDPNLLRVLQQYQKEGKIVMPNESEAKYSAMLLELVQPYHEPVPDIDELEALLNLAMIAWNMANMKKLVPLAYKAMLEETKKDLAGDKKDIQILEKLIKEKEKKFGQHDLFIHEFQMNQTEDDQFYITVTAKPLESFLFDTVLDEPDEDDDEFESDFMPGYINRNAFLLKSKQPFREWMQKTEGNSLFPAEINENHVYLIGERSSSQEVEKWLKKNFDIVFKKELGAWHADEKQWPANRTYKMFKEWFDVVHHSMVYDLEDYPVDKGL